MSIESEKARRAGAHAAYGVAIERHKQLSNTAPRADGLGIRDPLEAAMRLNPRGDLTVEGYIERPGAPGSVEDGMRYRKPK